ncbi:adenosine deaminase [Haliovirga abyssi]|uniref:adenosine deaminase n=1 Tax=Haliovirga abyssi TaxID=2996794 RepID=A0AAU9DDH0_9FUSO|nr:adenosine deaminase [Haliovirga abyssi]BDU50213.1 adenosine deaminase [Haliovirga abyssi]
MIDFKKVKKMKKAEIHLHLDGSMRIETILDLAKKDGIELPTYNFDEFRKYVEVEKDNSSLIEYLKKFELPLMVLQDSKALERTAYELIEDLAKDNYIYVEIRFAPLLHLNNGMKAEEVVESVLRGLKKAKEKFGVESGLLLSVMRHMSVEDGKKVLELGKKYKDSGVVGLDMAGDEKNYSPLIFKEVFEEAREAGINFTIHAGEAAGVKSIREAIELGAKRLGHGIRAFEDEELLKEIKEKNIVLEVCPISNFQTKVLADFHDYPIKKYLKMGIKLSLNTDNRTVSNTNFIKELKFLEKYFDFENEEIEEMVRNSVRFSFAKEETKKRLLEEL